MAIRVSHLFYLRHFRKDGNASLGEILGLNDYNCNNLNLFVRTTADKYK